MYVLQVKLSNTEMNVKCNSSTVLVTFLLVYHNADSDKNRK